jgi:hypothetical protein
LSTRIDIYDISTDSWTITELPDLQFGNDQEGIAVAAGNKAYFCGGDRRDIIYVYDVINNSWSTEKLTVNRGDYAAAFVGNKLFIAGISLTPNIVDVYDVSTGTWSLTTLSEGRSSLKAATFNNKAFFAGGWLAGQSTALVDIYDNSTQKWSITYLSGPTVLDAIAPLGQSLLFFGPNDHIDIYDPSLNNWSMAELTQNFTYDKQIISIGGEVYISKGKEVWRIQL